jgi:hypothetical protein
LLCSFGVYFRGPCFVSEMAALYGKLGPLISTFNTRYGRTPWGHFIISHLTSSSMALEKPAMSFISTGFGLLGTILIVLLAAVYRRDARALFERHHTAISSYRTGSVISRASRFGDRARI